MQAISRSTSPTQKGGKDGDERDRNGPGTGSCWFQVKRDSFLGFAGERMTASMNAKTLVHKGLKCMKPTWGKMVWVGEGWRR